MPEHSSLASRDRTDSLADRPHAFDPVTEPGLFQGVIGKRCIAFIVDAVIILVLTALAYVAVAVLGIVTLGLAWLLFGLVFPAVGLGYNAVTIGGPNSATIGHRVMGLQVWMWHGGKVSPLIAAFQTMGLRVPDDLSVVAICPDETAEQAPLPISSVSIPSAEIGTRAVDLLMAKLAERDDVPETTTLPATLTHRATSAATP